MLKILLSSKKKKKMSQGFSLIELMVAMFIFVLLMGAMVAVSVAGFRSYGKSKAVKTVTEDVGFAINSIAKDVRMGRIEKFTVSGADWSGDGTTVKKYFAVTLNRNAALVCYYLGSDFLGSTTTGTTPADPSTGTPAVCPAESLGYYNSNKIVDLSGAAMTFHATSGFYSKATDTTSATKMRGWVEINLNIENPSMEKDSIRLQTIVSSRDYGWEETP